MLLPSEIQVDPERWQAGLASLGLDPQGYDPEVPTRIFRDLLDRHGVATLDLSPVFARIVSAGETPYLRFDRHWKIEGHVLAAKELAGFLAASR